LLRNRYDVIESTEDRRARRSSGGPRAGRRDALPADPPETLANRELSWLRFADRVLAQVCDPELPLLERVKFAGIVGMLHDEFFMKRMSGLKRQITENSCERSMDGLTPQEEFASCRRELLRQGRVLGRALTAELLPGLEAAGFPIVDYRQLDDEQRQALRRYYCRGVEPILTPLAVDAEHPFPFISSLGLNLAVLVTDREGDEPRFVRIKVPNNIARWVPLGQGKGFVPLEQVIAANLDLMFPNSAGITTYAFRFTRGAEGTVRRLDELTDEEHLRAPGSLVQIVSNELKARKFAGGVRLEIEAAMPARQATWLCRQLGVTRQDVYRTAHPLAIHALAELKTGGGDGLSYPPHEPAVHPRLRRLDRTSSAIFDEIARGEILLHHPYHCFRSSVLRFLQSAAEDPAVLAIKLTIYRTGVDSPIVRALVDASRRGKQVAVLVEITARFDEAPNIAWGKLLEQEGVHVSYGVERLKTHVKLALVVRQEGGELRRYAHVGTGNYNVHTARIYEDLGLLTCDPEIADDVAAAFNALTGATTRGSYRSLIVAPQQMRGRFVEMIRREAAHAAAGRPSGIWAKLNQLQDPEMIRELYAASRAGVPITLNVRGLCCLKPGVPGLSETVRVYGLVGRFLEHSRLYRFANAGRPEYYIGSADWMKRNLDRRVEIVVPLRDLAVRRQVDRIIETYEADNWSVWDGRPDGNYARRRPRAGESRRAAQELFAHMAANDNPAIGRNDFDDALERAG
jgi:polyphosphate kinase